MRSQAPCQKDDFMERNSSRRSFLKGSALTGAAYVLGRRVLARPNPLSVIVVGAGAFGGWTRLGFFGKARRGVSFGVGGRGTSAEGSAGEKAISAPTNELPGFTNKLARKPWRSGQGTRKRWA